MEHLMLHVYNDVNFRINSIEFVKIIFSSARTKLSKEQNQV